MILPVILSGGSGSRLWPLSRSGFPKQFHALGGDGTLLAETAARVGGEQFHRPLVITSHQQRFLVAHALGEASIHPSGIILEPEGRNTAPALTVAALWAAEHADDGMVVLALPSDHIISDVEGLRAAIRQGAAMAQSGYIVTFGIVPDRPHTGYGYIEAGEAFGEGAEAFHVRKFVEKPDQGAADRMFQSRGFYWNSGIFMFTPTMLLRELERFRPAVIKACRRAVDEAQLDLDFLRLDESAFTASPSISIDHAVMERTEHAAVLPVELGWSDIGSWQAIWEVGQKDRSGNVLSGRAVARDLKGCLVRSDGPLVAAIGLENVAVIATDDAVLALPRARAEEVKSLVDDLKAEGYPEHELHKEVHRPWGSYRRLSLGDRFQVKEIVVRPGHFLSLQLHHHRAEHWVIVQGTAKVTKDGQTCIISENESIFIPLGVKHRLHNPGRLPLRLIEVQTGAYLGEDDIVRFDDSYGRDQSD